MVIRAHLHLCAVCRAEVRALSALSEVIAVHRPKRAAAPQRHPKASREAAALP